MGGRKRSGWPSFSVPRYGSENQTSLYRTQLKCRRRIEGESLATLVNDVRRMVALAYPGPTSSIKEAVACDAFLEALNDPSMALKVREREPSTLEETFQCTLRLEADAGSVPMGASDKNDRDRMGHCRMAQIESTKPSEDRWLEYLRELERRQQENLRRLLEEVKGVLAGSRDNASAAEAPTAECLEGPSWQGRGVRRPKTVTCFGCGEPGHFRNQCPGRRGTEAPNDGGRTPNATDGAVTNHNIKGKRGFYLEVKIGERNCRALIDTGSEICLVPPDLVEGATLEPSSQQLRAANGTAITVLGETLLRIQIGTLTLPIACVVVDNVTEILIGMSWLSEHADSLDLKNGRITIGGKLFQLKRSSDCRAAGGAGVQALSPRRGPRRDSTAAYQGDTSPGETERLRLLQPPENIDGWERKEDVANRGSNKAVVLDRRETGGCDKALLYDRRTSQKMETAYETKRINIL